MDELDRMFRRLVDVVRADYPSLIDRPIEVGELYQSVLPYRHHRRALGFETNQDYELAMMRLLSGERGYVVGDPRMQERLRQELGSSNPDSALFRGFATTTVTLDPESVRRASASTADGASSAASMAASPSPAARPVADQPVPQRVADDRAPERARTAAASTAPASPSAVPVSSPDAETIVFRRSPAGLPPVPPAAAGASQSAAASAPAVTPAPAPVAGAGSSASRPTEPILARSNETPTIRPSGDVESSLGSPGLAAGGSGTAAPSPSSSAPSPAPLPSVGPPPRPRPSPQSASAAGSGESWTTPSSSTSSSSSSAPASATASSTDAAPRSGNTASTAAAESRGASRGAANTTSPSPRSPMATPQRGANTIVASGDCRYCGGALPDGRRITFCPHCGQNLTIQHCPACSSELELGWKFCTTCGRAVGETAAAARG